MPEINIEHLNRITQVTFNRPQARNALALAVACDLRIGGTTLKFGYPIARTVGNCLSLSNCAR